MGSADGQSASVLHDVGQLEEQTPPPPPKPFGLEESQATAATKAAARMLLEARDRRRVGVMVSALHIKRRISGDDRHLSHTHDVSVGGAP